MKKFRLRKLVRNNELEWISKNGGLFSLIQTSEVSKMSFIKDKIREELDEVFLAKKKSDKTSEVADLIETIYAFCKYSKIDIDEVHAYRERKNKTRGDFTNFIVVDEVSVSTSSPLGIYLLSNPSKYQPVL